MKHNTRDFKPRASIYKQNSGRFPVRKTADNLLAIALKAEGETLDSGDEYDGFRLFTAWQSYFNYLDKWHVNGRNGSLVGAS